jgi:hypothetical protein
MGCLFNILATWLRGGLGLGKRRKNKIRKEREKGSGYVGMIHVGIYNCAMGVIDIVKLY